MDDGLRLFVDGNLLIDDWVDGGVREWVVDAYLGAGIHTVRVEYYERTGAAIAQVWWERVQPGAYFPNWKGEYYPNIGLTGSPAIVRNEQTISFEWGLSSPGTSIPVDNFSARWTRTLTLDGGRYRFHVSADEACGFGSTAGRWSINGATDRNAI